jgi:hypothetical protein
VSSLRQWILAEALVCGLAGDAELAGDLGPGVSLGAGAGDGGGECAVGLAGGGVGISDPAEDVECLAGRQCPGGGAFAEGGAGQGARAAQRDGAEQDLGGQRAVRAAGRVGGVVAADGRGGVRFALTEGWGAHRDSGGLGGGGLGGEDALQGVVVCGVVGGVVLPAVPDDEQPGAGQDADGVGVVVAAGAGSLVEVGGPGAGVAGVAGEVGDGVAELLVAGPAEGNGAYLARLAGRGRGAGEAGEGFGGGEPGAAVADLGEQPCGADGARTGSEVKT